MPITITGIIAYVAFGEMKADSERYVLNIVVHDEDGDEAQCSDGAIESLREAVFVKTYNYIKSSKTGKPLISEISLVGGKNVYDVINLMSSDSDILTLMSNDSDVMRIFAYIINRNRKKLNIYLSLKGCYPVEARVYNGGDSTFVPNISGNIDVFAKELSYIIDDYIPVVELIYDNKTILSARNIAFKKILSGKKTKWYKNLVAVTYLKESILYDPIKNRNIRKDKFDSAKYWLDEALKEDRYFAPAINNYVSIFTFEGLSDLNSYDEAIRMLMEAYYRASCWDCLSRASYIRIKRYFKFQSEKKFNFSNEFRIARFNLEYKIRKVGSKIQDIQLLYEIVRRMERGEYVKYLNQASLGE